MAEDLYLGLKQGTICDPELSCVIAAGPLTRQPGTMPYRHVLVRYASGKFSVHTEFFTCTDAAKGSSSLGDGHYFPAGRDGFVAAQRKFAERIAAHAEYHATIYRDLSIKE